MSNSTHAVERKGTQAMDKAKEAGNEALQKGKQVGAEAMDKAKEVGEDALAKVKEAGGQALGKAKEAASSVGEMCVESASAAGHKADDLTGAAGHQIREFGDTISKKMPHEGFTGKASQVVADTIKEGGRYIEEAKLSGMAHDVESVVKNHPIPALLLVFGIGFCLGRVLKD
jgi:ElaB/YqjD/DUF883 family membrane-anchored ribosome-binding protein